MPSEYPKGSLRIQIYIYILDQREILNRFRHIRLYNVCDKSPTGPQKLTNRFHFWQNHWKLLRQD